MESIFYGGKTSIFRAKNLSVNTWRSGPDICSLICDAVDHSLSCDMYIVHTTASQETLNRNTCVQASYKDSLPQYIENDRLMNLCTATKFWPNVWLCKRKNMINLATDRKMVIEKIHTYYIQAYEAACRLKWTVLVLRLFNRVYA